MTLAALIAAYHESDEPGDGLRATLPLAGRTLVERQARLAAAVGADPVIILVERVPAALAAAIDRLRSEGISAVVARSADDAAQAVRAEDRLLIMADGLIADERHIARIAGAEGLVLLTIPDHSADERFERIDPHSRWAGLAMVDGGLLGRTADMLQDWDLQSTLLRQAVQSGARQFSIRGETGDPRLTVAERASDLSEVHAEIVASASGSRGDWASRYLLAPVEVSLTRLLMPTAATPEWLHVMAAALTGLAAFLFAGDWVWAGGVLLLMVTPLDGVAERLARLRMQPAGIERWWSFSLPALAGAALLALGYSLADEKGWGCAALAAAALAFVLATHFECRDHDVEGGIFLAERKGMSWLMLPFALTGAWVAGLAGLAIYAAGSFFWAQYQVHRPASGAPND